MPVLRTHPLNVGRRRWYLATDSLGTGVSWPDLVSRADAILYSPAWGPTTREGGRGQLNSPAGRASWPRPTAGFTVSAWVYSDGIQASDATIVHAGNVILRAYTDDTANRVILYAFVGGAPFYVRSHTTLPADAWTHVTGTYDGTDLRIYLDGVWSGDFTALAPGAVVDATSGEFTIGFESLTPGMPPRAAGWVGAIDDVSVWDRGFAAQEAEDSFNEGVAGHPATLDFTTGPPPTGGFLPLGTAAGYLVLRQNV